MTNNRFKFRVWDNAENNYNGFSFHLAMSGELDRLSVDGDLLETDEERFIIEQCTGLKDKNGKLIFEGDMVRYYRSTAMCLGGEQIAQVLWDARDAEFGILTTLGDGYNMMEALRFGIEIIGNIHEMESEND